MDTELSLLRLLQLVSPSLPIGAYSYSQGLEAAIEDQWINNANDLENWLRGLLHQGMARTDMPILTRLYKAWQTFDYDRLNYWTDYLAAYRESSELREEDRQTGRALARLLVGMNIKEAGDWQHSPHTTLATLFSLAAVKWHISLQACVQGYVWSWLENQILSALKLMSLGQMQGQQMLNRLAQAIPSLTESAMTLKDDDIGGGVFALALASSRHEVQYSRLFRS